MDAKVPLTRLQSIIAVCAACVVAIILVVTIGHSSGSAPSFTFSSDEDGITWTCQLDAGTIATCTSPKNLTGLAPGPHSMMITGSFTVPNAPPPPGATLLLGNKTVQSIQDGGDAPGSEAFGFTAVASGTAKSLSVYLDSTDGAQVALYADSAGKPAARLDTATINSNAVGWTSVPLTGGVNVTNGTKYWIVVGAKAGGTIRYRDLGSSGSNLDWSGSGFPDPYGPRFQWSSNPISAYVSGDATSTSSTTSSSSSSTTSNSTTSSSTTTTISGLPPGVTLRPIDGGPNYYCSNGFTQACNAGWDNPSFVPIVDDFAFYPGNSTSSFKSLGLNSVVRVTGGSGGQNTCASGAMDLSTLKNAGIWGILSDESNCNIGSETVGVHVEEPGDWSNVTSQVTSVNGLFGISGRFLSPVFTWNQLYYENLNGSVCGGSGTMTMQQVMSCTTGMPAGRHLDIPTDDQYWFAGSNTSFGQTYPGGDIYGGGMRLTADQMARGDHYGDMVDMMRAWVTVHSAPAAPYIETEDGLLSDTGVRRITPPELNWAAWSTIVHGARMLLYFGTTSNFGSGSTFGFSKTVLSGQTISMYDQAKATNTQVENLAPAINSPFAIGYVTVIPRGYVFPTATKSLTNGIDVMAKHASDGFYVFATVRGSESQTDVQATFTTADNYTGPVTVVGENRTVEAAAGVFRDTFAKATTVHIYQIPG